MPAAGLEALDHAAGLGVDRLGRAVGQQFPALHAAEQREVRVAPAGIEQVDARADVDLAVAVDPAGGEEVVAHRPEHAVGPEHVEDPRGVGRVHDALEAREQQLAEDLRRVDRPGVGGHVSPGMQEVHADLLEDRQVAQELLDGHVQVDRHQVRPERRGHQPVRMGRNADEAVAGGQRQVRALPAHPAHPMESGRIGRLVLDLVPGGALPFHLPLERVHVAGVAGRIADLRESGRAGRVAHQRMPGPAGLAELVVVRPQLAGGPAGEAPGQPDGIQLQRPDDGHQVAVQALDEAPVEILPAGEPALGLRDVELAHPGVGLPA